MKMFKMTAGGGQALLRNKQSALRKALLYILTPIFCVALCVGAVFSFSLNNKEIKASAATFKSTFTQLFAGQSDIGRANRDRTLTDFASGQNESFGSCSFSDGVATATKVAMQNNVAAYISFKAELVLPAYTKCSVVYSYEQYVKRTSSVSSPDSQLVNFLYYYGDSESGGSDKSASETFPCSTTGSDDTVTNSSYFVSGIRTRIIEEKTYSGELPKITYENDTGSSKTCTAYFGFYAQSQFSGAHQVGGTYKLTITEDVTVESVNVKPDKTTDVYSPTGNAFNFDYDQTKVKLSKVAFTKFGGTETTTYDGTGTSPIDASGACTLNGAGTYVFEFDITGNTVWSDTKDKSTKKITITIEKAKPNVKATFKTPLPDPIYTSYNGGALPEIENTAASPTAGKLEWQVGQTPSSSNSSYYWWFAPDDTDNYNSITGRTEETKLNIAYKAQKIKNLELTLREVDGTPVKIYDAFTLTDGDFSLKKYVTVKAVYEDGTTKETLGDSAYEFELDDGSDKLSEGTATLIAIKSDDGKSGTLTITVLKSEVKALLATYKDSGTHLKYSDTLSYDDIKKNLTVKAQWNYSGDDYVEVTDKSQYTISGDIKAGSPITLTVNYKGISKDFKPVIDKGDYNVPDSLFADKTVGFMGTAFDPTGWIDESKLPTGMTVTYSCPTDMTTVGEHTVTAKFSNPDSANYNDPVDKTAKLTISALPVYDMTGVELSGSTGVTGDRASGFTATYDGSDKEISADTSTLPDGVSVDTVVYEKKQADDTWATVTGKPNGVGEYCVTVKFKGAADHAAPDSVKTTLTIEKADYELPDDLFADKSITYTGEKFDPAGWIDESKLPDGVTVTYTCGTDLTSIGEHVVTAKFTNPDPDNYNDIEDMTAKLTISDKAVVSISAKIEDGAKFTAADTLDDLKKVISAEVEYNNGTKEAVAVDSLTLTCDTLREGGKFEVGSQTVTITYNDGTKDFTTTVTVTVAKAKVALPVYKGTLSYTGLELKPTANDFDGYDSTIMSFVENKTVAGLNAGAYKAVFALKDSDRYEWATTTSLKKSVFAAAVFDGETEIALEANEAAVDWNIAKAKISAVTGEDGKPVFKSEGVSAAILAQAVGLKFYKDEACTQEVSADELSYETTYYLQAELLDGANFEFDGAVAEVVGVPYTTPAKELTFWEKVVNFLKANWLWIVIAVVALILLITIIALAARSAKKKRIREERRLAEEKAERERKEEERRQREDERRREEREERMMRMNQQAMPQMMMPQPQYMPQAMPQSAQPMAMGGGADNAQLARIEAELSNVMSRIDDKIDKLKSDIKIEKLENAMSNGEIAALRNDVNSMRNDFTYAKRDEQVVHGGISLDRLTELIRTEVNNAFDSREKATAQTANATTDSGAANASPVAAQVPPDAVMTTVTTTKIDTTKKAQGTHDTAQPTRQTRSFVPPMPVDDGRVFDVGGFYKPADPMDLESGEEDNK